MYCLYFFQVLQTEYDWITTARDFQKRWNFVHCIGCLYRTEMIPPAGSGWFFFNYKHRHSMVLLTTEDANYRFILFDFDMNGRVSDSVLQNTEYFWRLQRNSLNILRENKFTNSLQKVSYISIADFSFRSDMRKPYRQSDLNCIKQCTTTDYQEYDEF